MFYQLQALTDDSLRHSAKMEVVYSIMTTSLIVAIISSFVSLGYNGDIPQNFAIEIAVFWCIFGGPLVLAILALIFQWIINLPLCVESSLEFLFGFLNFFSARIAGPYSSSCF